MLVWTSWWSVCKRVIFIDVIFRVLRKFQSYISSVFSFIYRLRHGDVHNITLDRCRSSRRNVIWLRIHNSIYHPSRMDLLHTLMKRWMKTRTQKHTRTHIYVYVYRYIFVLSSDEWLDEYQWRKKCCLFWFMCIYYVFYVEKRQNKSDQDNHKEEILCQIIYNSEESSNCKHAMGWGMDIRPNGYHRPSTR